MAPYPYMVDSRAEGTTKLQLSSTKKQQGFFSAQFYSQNSWRFDHAEPMVWINKAVLHFYEAQHFTTAETAFIVLSCLDNQTTSGARVKKANQYKY